jgi:hypothetical protein
MAPFFIVALLAQVIHMCIGTQRVAIGTDGVALTLSNELSQEGARRQSMKQPSGDEVCTEVQCDECAQCLLEQTELPSCDPGASGLCIDPDSRSDDKSYDGIKDCDKALMSCGTGKKKCYERMLCNHPCICNGWKNDECDGSYTPYHQGKCSASNAQSAQSMIERSSHARADLRVGAASNASLENSKRTEVIRMDESLDDALNDKCRG